MTQSNRLPFHRYCFARLTGILTVLAAFSAGSLAGATTEEIIALARGYYGSEAKLEGVETLVYETTIVDKQSGAEQALTMYLEKPHRQRMEITDGNVTQIEVLDGLEGWSKVVVDRKDGDPVVARFRVLPLDQIRKMRASTWENLYFYEGIERLPMGRVENMGEVEKLGQPTYWLRFNHGREIHFDRYFEKSSGRLLVTVTAEGLEIRDLGETVVDGIRFPERQMLYMDGKPVNEITFDSVSINRDLPDDLFAMPTMNVEGMTSR